MYHAAWRSPALELVRLSAAPKLQQLPLAWDKDVVPNNLRNSESLKSDDGNRRTLIRNEISITYVRSS
jgi:hypothetical protein